MELSFFGNTRRLRKCKHERTTTKQHWKNKKKINVPVRKTCEIIREKRQMDGRKSMEEGDAEVMSDLRKCQREIVTYRHNCDREIEEIERGYAESVKPHLHHRTTLTQCIPRFWSKAILNHPLISTVFEAGESEVLNYLTNLEIHEDPKNPDYFKLHFSFRKNPYFENRTLTKEFREHGSFNTEIRWKKGQRFPRMTKHELWEEDDLGLEYKGFFRWFLDPSEHYCDPIADIIKTSIWYNPLEFYDRIDPPDHTPDSKISSGMELRKTVKDKQTKLKKSRDRETRL